MKSFTANGWTCHSFCAVKVRWNAPSLSESGAPPCGKHKKEHRRDPGEKADQTPQAVASGCCIARPTPPRIGPDLAGRATANHASAKAGETEVNTGEGPGRREGLAQNRSCSAIAPVGSADHRGALCQCPCGCTSWAREGAPGTSSRARTGWGRECYSLAIKAGEDSSGQSSDVLSTYGDVCGFRVRAGQANDESTIRQKEGRAHVRSKSMWVSAPGRCGYWPLTTCLAR
jgi:hypothetical protein